MTLLDRLRKAAVVLCDFDDTDSQIVRILLNCNADPKWQEKRFSAKWTFHFNMNWESKKQKPCKNRENLSNGPIKIYHRFLLEGIACIQRHL